ncbi:DoxX family protein [Hymenobacter sp. HMF4947]|uniref:DoxX family protein n=1 Tax=Hymenobacter ginkgonis TaxID=2682976 RepID=A0A7K1TLF5_9BACT|nr:DoxX family protein [Hymenobacter ginkgonis]MVN79249.1 DoxX family protein [Hymenobacter ginkgonis]
MRYNTARIIYWSSVGLLSLWFGASGVSELTKNPLVWDITVKLGYPPHFIYILGVAKVLGVAVLLVPNRLLRLKEWVFAGILFDITFAFLSKIVVLGAAATIDTLIAFTIFSTAYTLFRRLYPATYTRAAEVEITTAPAGSKVMQTAAGH